MRFVDTNILLYAVSFAPAEAEKALRASDILSQTDLALSTQVLQEFYVQATRSSTKSPLTSAEASALISTLTRFPIADITPDLVQAAIASQVRWQISYWDAAIIEAARTLGCDVLLSEDLQDGQEFGGVRVVNPFRA
jgi:predicted nucleic acid-binding protein